MSTAANRTRTVTWDDPAIAAGAVPGLSGLEFLRAVQSGELPPPPLMVLLGLRLVAVDEGSAVFTVTPAEYHYNPLGVVHGGLACTICDSAMGCAIHSTLPAGTGYITLELKVNLIRPLTMATGLVRCEGKVIHAGGRTATAEARLFDTRRSLYAHATCTCLLFRPPREQEPSESRSPS